MRFADQVDQLLMPNRVVNRLSFPFPFKYPCNFEGSNEYILEQTKSHAENKCLILINPNMDKRGYIEELLLKIILKVLNHIDFIQKQTIQLIAKF